MWKSSSIRVTWGHHVMLCYVMLWLFVKRLSQKAIQKRSQRDRQVKRKVFKLRRDADDIPCSITLRSAGGVSFQSAGPTTGNARFWYIEQFGTKVQEDHSDQKSVYSVLNERPVDRYTVARGEVSVSSWDGSEIILSLYWREFLSERRSAMAMEQILVKRLPKCGALLEVEEVWVERSGWIVNSWQK